MFIVQLWRKDCQTCKITETACDSAFESFSKTEHVLILAMVNLSPLLTVVH